MGATCDPLTAGTRLMPLQLVLDEHDRIDLPLDDGMLEAWRLQLDRAFVASDAHVLRERLAACFAAGLLQCLDWDLQPPTEKQTQYAMDIARALNVAIPGEALRYRASMTEFLDRYADVFKAQRIRRSQQGGALNSAPDE